MESLKLQFLSSGVFAPRDKEAASARVVRVGEEAEPVKIRDRLATLGISPELLVYIGRVIERMALDKNGQFGKGLVAIRQMMQIGVRFTSLVGQLLPPARAVAFVVNRDTEVAGDTLEPREVFVVAGDDYFKGRMHGV
jgi:hypothetical protein